ncbi:short chain dehydrogenase [Phlyctochytrium arcticum]|nr:short chain dehydrogenase [Phlyctochytrium arcticum]
MVFGFFEKHFEAADLPDLTGKVALVTGGNTGIGYETIFHLAKKGAKVYMGSRTQSRAEAAIEKIKKDLPESTVEWVSLDLNDLATVKKAAEDVLGKTDRLDILVNNAGVMACPYELTKDGVEIQFQTNHLGHFLLTTKLLPLMKTTSKLPNSSVRIVNVSSLGHKIFSASGMNFDTLENVNKEMSSAFTRYGQSKLANVLFTKELARQVAGDKIFVNTLHPGNINTELMRGPIASYGSLLSIGSKIAGAFLLTPYQGALTSIYCAGSQEIEEKNYRGEYFVPYAKLSAPSAAALDETKAKNLWALSEQILRDKGLL